MINEKKTATLGELASYYGISVRTLQRKLKPYRKFFSFDQRKRIYYPDEVEFVKKLLGDK